MAASHVVAAGKRSISEQPPACWLENTKLSSGFRMVATKEECSCTLSTIENLIFDRFE